MKVRPILILILLTTAVAMVGWMYYAVLGTIDEKPQKTHRAVIEDLDACCRQKHIKSAQYEHFAVIADREEHRSAADLFRAMAHSERVQEQYCATVIHRLGGRYTPPRRVILFQGTTSSNLQRSINLFEQQPDTLFRRRIGLHLYGGNRMAAQALIWAAASDRRHARLLQHARDHLASSPTWRYTVCPRCGNTYLTASHDLFCPHCLTDSREFVEF